MLIVLVVVDLLLYARKVTLVTSPVTLSVTVGMTIMQVTTMDSVTTAPIARILRLTFTTFGVMLPVILLTSDLSDQVWKDAPG